MLEALTYAGKSYLESDHVQGHMMDRLAKASIDQMHHFGETALFSAGPDASIFERWQTVASKMPVRVPTEAQLKVLDALDTPKGAMSFLFLNAKTAVLVANNYFLENPDSPISKNEAIQTILISFLTTSPNRPYLNSNLNRAGVNSIQSHYKTEYEEPRIWEQRDGQPAVTWEDELTQKFLQEAVSEILKNLPERHKGILELRYGIKDGQEYTLRDIGLMGGVTHARVGQLVDRAMAYLRISTIANRSRNFIDGEKEGKENDTYKLASWPPDFLIGKAVYNGDFVIKKDDTVSGYLERLARIGIRTIGDLFASTPAKIFEEWSTLNFSPEDFDRMIGKFIGSLASFEFDDSKLSVDERSFLKHVTDKSMLAEGRKVRMHNLHHAALLVSQGEVWEGIFSPNIEQRIKSMSKFNLEIYEFKGRMKIFKDAMVDFARFRYTGSGVLERKNHWRKVVMDKIDKSVLV